MPVSPVSTTSHFANYYVYSKKERKKKALTGNLSWTLELVYALPCQVLMVQRPQQPLNTMTLSVWT